MKAIVVLTALALGTAPVTASEAGKAIFTENCSGCHQPGGIGSPGLAPPLADPDLWTGLGDKAETYIGAVLIGGLTGTITAKGETYRGLAMPSWSWMTDQQLADVASYVLGDLNELSATPTPEQIAAARATPLAHSAIIALRKEALP